MLFDVVHGAASSMPFLPTLAISCLCFMGQHNCVGGGE